MIDELDILKALKLRIGKFFTEKIEKPDFKNPTPPSFYVNFITSVDTQSAVEYEQNTFSFEIVYFAPTDANGTTELLKKKRLLNAVLKKPLKIIETWTEGEGAVAINYTKTSFVDIESSSSSLNKDDYTLNYIINIRVEQKIDYSDLGVDLDSDNLTDDENFNSEMLENMEAVISAEGKDISNFTDE